MIGIWKSLDLALGGCIQDKEDTLIKDMSKLAIWRPKGVEPHVQEARHLGGVLLFGL